MEYKYTTTFAAEVKPIISQEKDKFLSLAAADKLKSIIPEDIRGEDSLDLLPFAASLCNVGRANRNGDLVSPEVALAYYKKFNIRPITNRHKTSEILGTIVNAGLCKFESEDIITEEQAKNESVFNIAVAGVIYRRANQELANYLEDGGDPSSPYYGEFSLSWEIGFTDYDILIGSPYLSEGEVISNDSASFTYYDKLLTANGGAGRDKEEKSVYRLIKGQIYPLGAGIVERPAAYVKGIFTNMAEEDEDMKEDNSPEHEMKEGPEHEKEEMKEDMEDSEDSEETEGKCAACGEMTKFAKKDGRYSCAKCDTSYSGTYWDSYQDAIKTKPEEGLVSESNDKTTENPPILNNNASSSVDLNNLCVNKKEKIMKITKREDITDESLKEATASVINDLIESELKSACEAYTGQIKTKDEMIASAQSAIADLTKSLEELRAKVSEQDAKEASRSALEQLNTRLAAFDEKYNLTDESRATIGSRIKGMDETAFAEYEKELSVLFKTNLKTKESTAAAVEDPETSAAQAVASAAASPTTVTPPNAVAPSLSLKDRVKAAFTFDKVVTTSKR